MANADLRLYIGATEYGTIGNVLSFTGAVAGSITPHPLNPFSLWNDKGGTLGSVPARVITIQVLEMWIQDEVLGTSNGTPSQTFTAAFPPVVDNNDTTEIVVKVATVLWSRVGSFTGQLPTAQVYTINPTTGLVTLGNGVNGAIPTNTNQITMTYMPKVVPYGKEIFDNSWLEIQSLGATANSVTITSEQQASISTTSVIVGNAQILSVTGVWLATDPGKTGTNYYTGGSFNALNKILTLGTALPNAITNVIVDYVYTIVDENEAVYSPIGYNNVHSFVYDIPKNNAKLLYFRLNVPAGVDNNGGGNINFRIRINYQQ